MSEVETHQSNGKGHAPEVLFRASAARADKVFEFCKAHIAEHGRGPSLSVIAKGAEIPKGAVSGVVTRLHKEGRILLEPGNYASMHLPGAAEAAPEKRARRKPRGPSKARGAPATRAAVRRRADSKSLLELRAEFVEQIRAIDVVLKLL